jgi:hypothetical protein
MAELRLAVLLESERTSETVSEVCRRYRISRQTYYRYRKRFLAQGLEGLEDRDRRPHRCPAQIDPELEAAISDRASGTASTRLVPRSSCQFANWTKAYRPRRIARSRHPPVPVVLPHSSRRTDGRRRRRRRSDEPFERVRIGVTDSVEVYRTRRLCRSVKMLRSDGTTVWMFGLRGTRLGNGPLADRNTRRPTVEHKPALRITWTEAPVIRGSASMPYCSDSQAEGLCGRGGGEREPPRCPPCVVAQMKDLP